MVEYCKCLISLELTFWVMITASLCSRLAQIVLHFILDVAYVKGPNAHVLFIS
jgi:hypothetical protein